jgi:hypothetical protein
MLSSKGVPLFYKLFVPLGVLYQFTRASVKWMVGGWWRRKRPYFSDARV